MYHATIDGERFEVEIDMVNKKARIGAHWFPLDFDSPPGGGIHFIHRDRSILAELEQIDEETRKVHLRVNGKAVEVELKDRYDDLLKDMGMETASSAKARDVKAPMPGMVIEVLVSEGIQVEKDTPLVILEAMKMENIIKAPAAGLVRKVLAHKGVAVEKNTVLVEFAQ